MDSISIGLDIGSSAVRAAEIEQSNSGPILRRYAQVGLPPGAVTDGEIINVPVVAAALKRLWFEGGFSSTKVVVGVSGTRVIVRQADVPALSAADLRSSLKFDAQELIPIPMEDAAFDFSVLDENSSGPKDKPTKRILMVAAHKDVLRGHLAALRAAGLSALAVDPAALALMRVLPSQPTQSGGIEVIVSIGAELTLVGVRENGVPRFIRSLTVGGGKLTAIIANSMHLELAVAERLKRGQVSGGDGVQVAQARKAASVEMRDLAEDVRATMDFFVSQAEEATIERLMVTGGASQTEGLLAAIAGDMPGQVTQVNPFESFSIGDLGLDHQQLESAKASASTAIGLALWSSESPLLRLSVLPEEVLEARRARRLMTVAGCGLVGLVALLGGVGFLRHGTVQSAQDQVAKDQVQVSALTEQVQVLTAATAAHGQVAARASLVISSLDGDVDWVRVVGQLAAVMPSNLSLVSFSGTSALPTATTSTATQNVGDGTLTFSVKGTGGLPAAASWLNGLAKDPDLEGTWVSGISVTANGGSITFSSTSYLTNTSYSTRANEVKSEYGN